MKMEVGIKQSIAALVASAIIFSLLAACSTVSPENEDTGTFIEVSRDYDQVIVYHKDTKVMYAISLGESRTLTLLVNADGTPMVYDERNSENG